jgi:DNA-binding CsgD family transcriptional regulator
VDGSTADGDLLFQVRALGVLGDAQLLTGGAEGAARATEALQRARDLGTAMELADPDQARRLAGLAEGLLLLGETREAGAVLDQGAELVRRWPAQWGQGARAALDRAAALHLAATGQPHEALELLAEVVDRLRALPLPLDLARTLTVRGTVERRARHRSSSQDALAEAEELCLAHGAVPLLRQVQQERHRLTPGERTGQAAELTASESRMAGLVAAGATNREIAAVLFVSVKTVEGTLSRVYRKLGVRSRTALVQLALPPNGRQGGGHTAFTGTARVTPLIRGVAAS